MAAPGRNKKLHLLCYLFLIVATLITDQGGVSVLAARPFSPSSADHLQAGEEAAAHAAAGINMSWPTTLSKELGTTRRWRRMVGSRAPTCTYNECRGCRHRCSARGVPVDASDPINSAYHYRCFCHI